MEKRDHYKVVREYDHKLYGEIAAFSSTFGKRIDDVPLETRAQVEAYIMQVASKLLQG